MFPADEHAFLATILDRPADDVPRLVYADYLDETGNPLDAARADLIRVQIALDRLPEDDARRVDLADRQNSLLEAYRPAWTAPLASLGAKFQFRRGLPDAVAIDAATFLERGEELFDNTPVRAGRSFLRRIRLEDPSRVLLELVHSPLLNRIAELDFSECDLGNGGVSLLVCSPHLRHVKVLCLGRNRLDDAGAIALARTAALSQLEVLELYDNGQIGDPGAAALAESPFLAGLVELDLSGNEVNALGMRAIVSGPAMQRLHQLKLGDNPIREGIADLVRSDLFARIVARDSRVELPRCALESTGAEALASSPALHRITSLNLSGNYLGDAGVAALGRGRWDDLHTLRLAHNQITDAGAFAILAVELPRLQRLDLGDNRITRRGVEALKAAAAARTFSVGAANNGSEPMAALPPQFPRTEVDQFLEMKRGIAHPARPRA